MGTLIVVQASPANVFLVCMVGHNTLPATTGYQPDVSVSLCNDWPHPSLVGIVTPGKFQVLGIPCGEAIHIHV